MNNLKRIFSAFKGTDSKIPVIQWNPLDFSDIYEKIDFMNEVLREFQRQVEEVVSSDEKEVTHGKNNS